MEFFSLEALVVKLIVESFTNFVAKSFPLSIIPEFSTTAKNNEKRREYFTTHT